MKIWSFDRSADLDDARWLGRQAYDQFIVRAETAGEALQVAGSFERSLAPPTVGNETSDGKSALCDEKLYRLRVLPTVEAVAFKSPQGDAQAVITSTKAANQST